ncbi:MAG: B12-binding domain-containing radical SAM protein [candidate division Zixibacteria bacterium]|nr:B12-binding domain-containing radical SAM protein [Candidatus Tariuqbacter arcticus]
MRIFLTRPDSDIPAAPPPLGAMSLAAYIRQFRDDEIKIYDARSRMTTPEKTAAEAQAFGAEVVGISSFSMEAPQTFDLAREVKKVLPKAKVFVGGPLPSSDPDYALSEPAIDAAFLAEGEQSFLSALNSLEETGEVAPAYGIAIRENGGVIGKGRPGLIEDLNSLPIPAWDLVDLEYYFGKPNKRPMMNRLQRDKHGASIFTTRGCPYQCTYCHNIFGKIARKQTPERVIEELKMLYHQYGVRELEILDDIFNLDVERAKRIFDLMEREGLHFHITFPNGLRAELMDEELIDKFKRNGVYWMTFAIESGSPRIQKEIRKNLKLEKAKRNIELAAKKGINVNGFFMMGFLGETEADIMQTIDFAASSRLIIASFFILTPYPNTEIYRQAEAAGHIMSGDFYDYHNVSVNLSEVPTQRLWQLKRLAYRKFYLNPRRIWYILKANPFKIGLLDGIWMLFKMVFWGKEILKKKRMDND